MQVHASSAKRRRFSNSEKRRILSAADACQQPGDIGALMRREGIYSSHLCNWRKQRDAGLLGGNNAAARGPKADPVRAQRLVLEALQRDNARLQRKFDQAMLLIDVQKKVSMLIGLALPQSSATT
jgi:transposase